MGELERVLDRLIEDVIRNLWQGHYDYAAGTWCGAFLLAMELDFVGTSCAPDSPWNWLNVVDWTDEARTCVATRRNEQ